MLWCAFLLEDLDEFVIEKQVVQLIEICGSFIFIGGIFCFKIICLHNN